MKIGFIKLGLKTYFEKCGTGQGSNHELVTLFNLFKQNGHECVMISVSDKYEKYTGKVDYIFIINGPSTIYKKDSSCMFRNYFAPFVDLINNTTIFTQKKENYGHLEKIILIGNKTTKQEKDIKLGILLNNTNKKRSSKVLDLLDWLEYGEIRGNWKKETNKYLKESIPEDKVNEYLSRVKYTINITVNNKWVNQKYYEYLLNDVICFQFNSDIDNLCMEKDDFRRIKDEIELDEKIELLEKDEELYNKILIKQREEILESYSDGSFLYNFIFSKLKN